MQVQELALKERVSLSDVSSNIFKKISRIDLERRRSEEQIFFFFDIFIEKPVTKK